MSLYVDTDGRGRLVTSRPTVYPLATAVEDRIALTYVTREWYPDGEDLDAGYQARTRLSITDRHGERVWQSFRKDEYTPRFTWDGRDPAGNVLPAGDYVAVLKTSDQVGNKHEESMPLTISDQQLEQKTWTTTIPAAQVRMYTPFFDGCNSCEDLVPPVPSDRFEGGLSFRPDDLSAASYMGIPIPFPAAPVDTYRVSAFGGPTTPGSTDVGLLFATGGEARTPVGDGTTTVPWGPVRVDGPPFLPTGTQPVPLYFRSDQREDIYATHMSYDIASFTVDYRYYAPVG